MNTQFIHAMDESEAVYKLTQLVSDSPESDGVITHYRVHRIHRTFWQRMMKVEPRWRIDYTCQIHHSNNRHENTEAVVTDDPRDHETFEENLVEPECEIENEAQSSLTDEIQIETAANEQGSIVETRQPEPQDSSNTENRAKLVEEVFSKLELTR